MGRRSKSQILAPAEPSALSLNQIAGLFGVCPETALAWSRTKLHGFPPPILLGRIRRWSREAVLGWWQGRLAAAERDDSRSA
jgi:predicted DNA-binding transcriptional regulator AlpA